MIGGLFRTWLNFASWLKPQIPEEAIYVETPPADAFIEYRNIYWDGEYIQAKIYEMEKLMSGNKVSGFAIFESTATTLVVPVGFEAYLDEHRIFHLKEIKE